MLTSAMKTAAPILIGLAGIACAAAQDDAGMRKLRGRHITILTDLPPSAGVDELPQVFDAAVSQWAQFFGADAKFLETWKTHAFLMQNEQRFRSQGLLPDDLPPFLHGYQRGDMLWVREQPSDYYRRHLLLHEGTHAFMQRALGGTGAPWYMEGIAELLATHRWHLGSLRLNSFPQSRDAAPYWGRIKLVRESVASGRVLSLTEVFALEAARFREVRAYAWSWAAVSFLNTHPLFKDRFAALRQQATAPDAEFSARFWQQLAPDQEQLSEAWQLFVANLDYGYDLTEDLIAYRDGQDLTGTVRFQLQTNQGWQSTGVRLRAGRAYRIRARGQYQVMSGPENWPCEAGGVTLEYCDGQPKGMLLGALRPNWQPSSISPLIEPRPIGVSRTMTPDHDGILFLRINEPAGQRADNTGELTVRIELVKPPPK